MENLRFQTRLNIGFAILLLFSFSLGILAFFQLNDTNKGIQEMYEHPLAVSINIKEIKFNVSDMLHSMDDFLNSKNSETSKEALKKIWVYDSLINVQLHIAEQRSSGKDKDFIKIYNAYADFKFTLDKAIELKNSNKLTEGNLLMQIEGHQKAIFLYNELEVISNFAITKATEIYTQTINKIKFNRKTLVLFMSILLFSSLLSSYLISRNITKPINDLLHQLRKLYRKENDLTPHEIFQGSEQKLITNTVNELKNAYTKLNEFNSNLEKRVAERTVELRQSREALKRRNKELIIEKERAERSEQLKSAFLANMSHEIRTPMNAILGFSNLLKENNLEKDKKQKFLNLIQDSGTRLLSIISDVVDISKINAKQLTLNKDICNLNEIIDSLYFQFSLNPKAQRLNLEINKALDDDNCFIETDKNRLIQIISNLVENAIKFTKEGSIKYGYTIEDTNVQFFVEDTGIGINASDREIVFKRFGKIENEYSKEGNGTGLGLSIAKGLVELLGGTIWIDPTTKNGTKFLFTIPYISVNQSEKYVSIIKEEMNALKIGRKNILIVEDENTNFIYLREVLKKSNVKIFRAFNGLEALQLVKDNADIDLVFMDIKMPIMDGYEATIKIRNINSTIPIIALTAYTLSEDNNRAMEAGCNEYLSKPVSKATIENILLKYLKSSPKSYLL